MTRKPYLAARRGGIWSIWRIVGDGKSVRYVTSSTSLGDALDAGRMRRGSPAPLAPVYPIERLRAI